LALSNAKNMKKFSALSSLLEKSGYHNDAQKNLPTERVKNAITCVVDSLEILAKIIP
jgi:hypothetical protein